ncbi:4Fe-4S dicluster domain-containing protein [Pontixanthobacter gangjinensis]|uniref:Sulfite reductase subunit A n=1 Tax=Pontixanthobacter gangjinensis TaxID=1028742 RepID=A0A6I4SNF8_9SPHN|nr:4Fe-4S dicluster domain-containing protein [Pontixanthobacter gangjinensis]MXO57293.1 sulfite reductase subunit A [Pontixanthobacter gangjinensis]
MKKEAKYGPPALIGPDDLELLIQALVQSGRQVIGPVVRDDAIVYDKIRGVDDLPAGWTDRQAPGRYTLEHRADAALFGYAVGPHSWKRFLHPPVQTVWSATRGDAGEAIDFAFTPDPARPYAFIGVRACELLAIEIQDKVLRDGPTAGRAYAGRCDNAFIVAVNCSQPAETCFCVSMDAGPRAKTGFDLALTELVDDHRHEFLVEIGSKAGADLMAKIPHEVANQIAHKQANALLERTSAGMSRRMETKGIKELLQHNPEHPRWDDVANRCLSCGNCTMVCPTCFCTTTEDTSDLANHTAERVQKWDSCFSLDFSYIHSGSVRNSTRSRYRQWLTHKLAHWIDQFGTSGCVGCGRCMTWCPVGIDLTEEVNAIRADTGVLQ